MTKERGSRFIKKKGYQNLLKGHEENIDWKRIKEEH